MLIPEALKGDYIRCKRTPMCGCGYKAHLRGNLRLVYRALRAALALELEDREVTLIACQMSYLITAHVLTFPVPAPTVRAQPNPLSALTPDAGPCDLGVVGNKWHVWDLLIS